MDYEHLFVDNLGLIDQIVRAIARGRHLSQDETEELKSGIHLKLIEDDYDVLRKFERRSNLRTYLTIVANRFYLDWRNASWGKWRPSEEAKRQGPLAIRLEMLIARDGYTFEQAVETLRTNLGVTETQDQLYQRYLQFPVRHRRREVGAEELEFRPATGSDPDCTLEDEDRERRMHAIAGALPAALAELDPSDRHVLKLRFLDGIQVSRIAKLVGVEQKPLYRRLEQILRRLKASLEAKGIGRDDIRDLTGTLSAEIDTALDDDDKK